MPALPLATQANPSKRGLDQAEIIENAYVEPRMTDDGLVLDILVSPGLDLLATLSGLAGVRAIYTRDTDLLVVAGTALVRVDGDGVVTPLATGLPADGHVTIAENRRVPVDYAVCVASEPDSILYMLSGDTLTQVTDEDLLPGTNSICYHGGFFVTTTRDGASQVSEIADGTAWDPLDYDYVQKSPDGLLRVVSRGADIAYFGQKSIEFWVQYAPEVGMPFQFSTSKNAGLLAAGGLAQVAYTTQTATTDVFVFPATNHEGSYTGICVLEGYSLNKISHPGVDRDIEDEPDQANLVATSWVQGGHGWYCISGTNFSWAFDTFMGKWYRRSSYGSNRWQIGHVAALGNRLIAGSATAGRLYHMHREAFSEGDDPIVWTVQTPRFHAFPGRVQMNALHADVIPGVGHNSGVDHDDNPDIMMQWTEDGENWSPERWRSMGRQGAGRQDVRWNGLGLSRSRGRIFRFRSSAAVARGIRGASIDARPIA